MEREYSPSTFIWEGYGKRDYIWRICSSVVEETEKLFFKQHDSRLYNLYSLFLIIILFGAKLQSLYCGEQMKFKDF